MRKRCYRLAFLLSVLIIFPNCSAPFRGQPVATAKFHERAMTQSDGKLTISVVALGPQESQELFGAKLAKHRVQPVWLKISNQDKVPYWLLPINLDPDYYSSNEAAVRNHKGHSKEGRKEMDKYFNENQIAYYLPPGQTNEGFVYANPSYGAKEVNVELYKEGEIKQFDFVVPVPGLKIDYDQLDFEAIVPPDQMQEVSLKELRAELEKFPGWVSNKKEEDWGGDAVNIVLVGEDEDIFAAFIRRGWKQTEVRYKGSSFKALKSFLFGSPYDNAPVSDLYLFGRHQDVAYQKPRHSINSRNHLRLWLTPLKYKGKPVWIGSISRDIGVKFSTKGVFFVTHRIDSDVDEARDYLLQDFLVGNAVGSYAWVKGVGAVPMDQPRKNFTGDDIYTDGLRVVIFVSDKPVIMVKSDYIDWEYPQER